MIIFGLIFFFLINRFLKFNPYEISLQLELKIQFKYDDSINLPSKNPINEIDDLTGGDVETDIR